METDHISIEGNISSSPIDVKVFFTIKFKYFCMNLTAKGTLSPR